MSRLRPAKRVAGMGITLIRSMMQRAPKDAINLGLGQADLAVPSELIDALTNASSLRHAGYGPNAGLPALRERIGAEYGVDSQRVIVTCGVQEAIALAIFALIEEGDEVICPDPGFPVYATLTRMAGGSPISMRLDERSGFRPTWQALEPLLSDRTRLVVLGSPGNPTGAVASDEQWRELGEKLYERGIPVFSDEIYLALQGGTSHPSMLKHHAEALVSSGLSKSHRLAGWRLGWLIAPEAMVQAITVLHQHWVTSAPTLIQEAALAAFSPASKAEVQRFSTELAQRRERVLPALRDCGFHIAAEGGAFYVFVRHPAYADDLALAEKLLDAGVITIPGQAFGPGGRGYLRISFGAEIDQVLAGIDRIRQTLDTTRTDER